MPCWTWLQREWAADNCWLRVTVVIGGVLTLVALMGGR